MEDSAASRNRASSDLVAVTLLMLLSLMFFLTYFNRFAGLRSGDGEFSGGLAVLAHRLPYRDYYSSGPPLNQIKSAIELELFGRTLFVTRLCAVLERLLIAGVLYAWLRRTFSVPAAMMASLVGIIISAGDRTDPLASYNHDAVLLAMLCGFAASLSLEAKGARRVMGLAALAGLGAGLSVMTKQTVGLGALASVFVVGGIAVFRLREFRQAGLWVVGFTLGTAVPLAALALLLERFGLLRTCLRMLFVTGPAAKASGPAVFLVREVTVARGNPVWVSLAVLAVILSGAAIWRATRGSGTGPSEWSWAFAAGGCVVVIGVAELLALTSLPALYDFSKTSIYYALVGTAVLGVATIVAGWGQTGDRALRMFQIAVFAALSWSAAFMLSLSWPAFEAMTLPGLGLLLAAAIDGTRLWGRRFLFLVMAAMVFIQVRERLDLPFAFDYQEEPAVRFATHTSAQPMLRGMRLPAEEVRLLDDVKAASDEAKAHGFNSGFTFPEMSLIYSLTDLQFPTLAGSHNIDVMNDTFAREEAARLLAAPPAVVVYARMNDKQLAAQEAVWRGGKPSGQRDMRRAVDQIVMGYRLVGTYQLGPETVPIRLYVRPW